MGPAGYPHTWTGRVRVFESFFTDHAGRSFEWKNESTRGLAGRVDPRTQLYCSPSSSSSPLQSSDLLAVVVSTRSSSPPYSSAISPSSRRLPLPPLQRWRIHVRLCLLCRQAQPVDLSTPELFFLCLQMTQRLVTTELLIGVVVVERWLREKQWRRRMWETVKDWDRKN